MKTLFILSLYGATGVYDSAPLSYYEAATLFLSLSDAGAVISMNRIHVE